MSFYWQNAIQSGSQPVAYNTPEHGSTEIAWDNVNLGGGQQPPHEVPRFAPQPQQSAYETYTSPHTSAVNHTYDVVQKDLYTQQWAQTVPTSIQSRAHQSHAYSERDGYSYKEPHSQPQSIEHMPILPSNPPYEVHHVEMRGTDSEMNGNQAALNEFVQQQYYPQPQQVFHHQNEEQTQQSTANKVHYQNSHATQSTPREELDAVHRNEEDFVDSRENSAERSDETPKAARVNAVDESKSPQGAESIQGGRSQMTSGQQMTSRVEEQRSHPIPGDNSSKPKEANIECESQPFSAVSSLQQPENASQKTPTPTDSWVEVGSSSSEVHEESKKGGNSELGGTVSASAPPLPLPSHPPPPQAQPDSDSTQDSKLANVRDRYKSVRAKYPELLNRMTQYRQSLRVAGEKTPRMLANPLLGAPIRPATVVPGAVPSKSSTPKEAKLPPAFAPDLSAIDNAEMYGERVRELERNWGVYGEDYVNTQRKERLRAARNSRPGSRARSETGDLNGVYENRSFSHFDNGMHQRSFGYYGMDGFPPVGRHSVMAVPYTAPGAAYYQPAQRSRSTFDQAAQQKFQQSGLGQDYDVYSSESSGADVEERGEGRDTEDEMISIHRGRVLQPPVTMMRGQIAAPSVRTPFNEHMNSSYNRTGVAPVFGAEETYYCGAIQLDLMVVQGILERMPPPRELWSLPAMERVAYIFFSVLHQKHFPGVAIFHNRFNKEFYKYTCEGCTANQALTKICHTMQEEAKMRRQVSNQKAYEESRRQLFSDDRDTPESREMEERADKTGTSNHRFMTETKLLSERGSLYDPHEFSDGDAASLDMALREPLLFRNPHSFAVFGAGGRLLRVRPFESVSVVDCTDVCKVVQDSSEANAIEWAALFKGPLFPHQTPPHVVRLYVHRQMERVRRSDLAMSDPRNDDVLDCLLIWQLLEMIVQQRGKVSGPDVSRLLMAASSNSPNRREVSRPPAFAPLELSIADPAPDPKAYERFSQFLLGGHIDEALDSAMRDALFGDALVLARRVAPHRLEELEAVLLSSRPAAHPVMSLLAVAGGHPPPLLSVMQHDDRASWRIHAAMLLANLCDTTHAGAAIESVRRLGEVLARRECHAAADFCFLCVALLAEVDVFTPPPALAESTSFPNSRRHVSLIHAHIPDDHNESTLTRFGFEVQDLHATEIFAYGRQLSKGENAPVEGLSLAYQRRRVQYAKLLASWGGFQLDAFRYGMETARALCYHQKERPMLSEVVDLDNFTQRISGGDEASVEQFNQMIAYLKTVVSTEIPIDNRGRESALLHEGGDQEGQTMYPEQQRRRQEQEEVQADPQREHQQMPPANQESSYGVGERRPSVHSPRHQQSNAPTAPPNSYIAEVNMHPRRESFAVDQNAVNSFVAEQHPAQNMNATSNAAVQENLQMRMRRDSHLAEDSTDRRGSQSAWEMNPLAPPQYSPSAEASPPVEPAQAPAASGQPSQSSVAAAQSQLRSAPSPTQPPQPQPYSSSSYSAGRNQPLQPEVNDSGAGGHIQQQSNMQAEQLQQGSAAARTASSGVGFGGWLRQTIIKHIPSTNEMKLPEDTKKTIYYDEKLGRYVGSGVEEESAPPPPPALTTPAGGGGPPGGEAGGEAKPAPAAGTLRASRSGSARYFNAMANMSGGGVPAQAPPPPMPLPTMFSFIPTTPDDAVSESPFSESTAPPPLPAELTGEAEEIQK